MIIDNFGNTRLTEKQLRKMLKVQKKSFDIIQELKEMGIDANERMWRDFVRKYNDEFDLHDSYIASNRFGYYLTTSKKKITRSAMNKFRNGLAQMRNAKKDLQILADKNQLSLLEEDANLFDMVMRMEI